MFLQCANMFREIFEEFERNLPNGRVKKKTGRPRRISFARLDFIPFCRTSAPSSARVGGVRADKCKSIYEGKQSIDKKQLPPEPDQSCWRAKQKKTKKTSNFM